MAEIINEVSLAAVLRVKIELKLEALDEFRKSAEDLLQQKWRDLDEDHENEYQEYEEALKIFSVWLAVLYYHAVEDCIKSSIHNAAEEIACKSCLKRANNWQGWDELVKNNLGFGLSDVSFYDAVDELRLIANSIKHEEHKNKITLNCYSNDRNKNEIHLRQQKLS